MLKHFPDNRPIICFHGSPGTEDDFLPLQNQLIKSTILPMSRKGYPSHSNHAIDPSGAFILGYSWGCREALEYSFKNINQISGVILISPYLINVNRNSISNNLYKYLFRFKHLAKIISHREIIKFFKVTSYPGTVPSNYFDNLISFANTSTFYRSICEKNESQQYSYASILRAINKCDIPIYIIYGEKDIYTDIKINVSLIKKISPESLFYEVKNGGHALLWTHTLKISEIIQKILKTNLLFQEDTSSILPCFQKTLILR